MRKPMLMTLLLAAGCAAADTPTAANDHAPPTGNRDAVATGDPGAPADIAHGDQEVAPPAAEEQAAGAPLDLAAAVQLGLAASPRADAARARLSAARSRVDGAGAFPESQLEFGVEGLPFATPREEEEWLVGLSLALPSPGERAAESGVASARVAVAEAALRSTLLEVDVAIRSAFADALLSEHAARLAAQLVTLRTGQAEIAAAEVAAGARAATGVLDSREAELRARAGAQQATRTAATARGRLDRMLPVDSRGRPLAGDLDVALALPELDALLARMNGLPQLAESAAEARLARVRAELAEARRIPRLTVDLAWRERADGRASLDAGLGVALPFGGQRGAEARAEALTASSAEALTRARWREVREALSAAYADAERARDAVLHLEGDLLPIAEQRVAMAEAEHAVGAEPLQTVLAERLRAAQLAIDALAARADYHQAWARLRPLLIAGD